MVGITGSQDRLGCETPSGSLSAVADPALNHVQLVTSLLKNDEKNKKILILKVKLRQIKMNEVQLFSKLETELLFLCSEFAFYRCPLTFEELNGLSRIDALSQ